MRRKTIIKRTGRGAKSAMAEMMRRERRKPAPAPSRRQPPGPNANKH
jgi:hypothetical protein